MNSMSAFFLVGTRSAQKESDLDNAASITEALIANPIETYRAIFRNPKKITSREMRYSGDEPPSNSRIPCLRDILSSTRNKNGKKCKKLR